MIKVITNDEEHAAALQEFRTLAARDPQTGTPERDALDLLVLVIDDYESRNFPFELPDPVDAIHFRMEQQGLSQRDLIPLLGSRSKVSEVLSRRRPLSLDQIRALSEGLGIPAKVLIQRTDDPIEDENALIQWGRFPAKEMKKRGWIETPSRPEHIDDIISKWYGAAWGSRSVSQDARFRTSAIRGSQGLDSYALLAWSTQIVTKAKATRLPAYKPGSLDRSAMQSLVHLSGAADGPRLACELLRDMGVAVIVESHLPKTRLDGAAIFLPQTATPIVGLTLRYDRIDNFWFTLMHELAHISLHLEEHGGIFYDDLAYTVSLASQEVEADELARDILIPPDIWAASDARRTHSVRVVEMLAEQLGINPAIVAGRIRHEDRDFRILSALIGQDQIKVQLKDM